MCLSVPGELSRKDMKAAALSGVCSFIKAKHGTTDCSYITVALMLVTDERFVKGGLKDSAIYFFILYTFYMNGFYTKYI